MSNNFDDNRTYALVTRRDGSSEYLSFSGDIQDMEESLLKFGVMPEHFLARIGNKTTTPGMVSDDAIFEEEGFE